MNINDMHLLHKMVWDFRREVEDYFPTPGREDSVAFAFTEAAEALDAVLREDPRYKRNNHKEHCVERELTQCAMMLLTAIGPRIPKNFSFSDSLPRESSSLNLICFQVATCLLYSSVWQNTLEAVIAIGTRVDLLSTLPEELDRMRRKHKPAQAGIIYPVQNERA